MCMLSKMPFSFKNGKYGGFHFHCILGILEPLLTIFGDKSQKKIYVY